MSSLQDLNDPNKTCIYLPARDDDTDETTSNSHTPSLSESRDLPNGHVLRLEAYRIAWTKCLERVQSIVRTLHAPVVSAITKDIHTAYSESFVLPGLPYAELPVVAVSAAGGSNTVLADVMNTLMDSSSTQSKDKGKGKMAADDEDDALEESTSKAIVAHVYPADCPNLAATMRAIIGGFVDYATEDGDADGGIVRPEPIKRKATTSLASYDINLLRTWYTALVELQDDPPILVVLLHDFEKLDPNVMSDVFYIFSQHIPRLPTIFVLAMTTPSPSAYLHAAFPRASLAMLRLHVHTAPSGRAIVEEVIQRTFFDIGFQPAVSLGPGVLDFLAEFCLRHTPLLDAALTILQIAHLKHFEEPFTVLVHDSSLGQPGQDKELAFRHPDSAEFLETLLGHLLGPDTQDDVHNDNEPPQWHETSVEDLVQMVDAIREEAYRKAQNSRLGYQVFMCAKQALRDQGIKTSVPNAREESTLEFLCRVARGKIMRDISYLVMAVTKLSNAQLESLLSPLYSLFYNLPASLRRQETTCREFITQARTSISANGDTYSDTASSVGQWLKTYLTDRLVRSDEGVLWQLWNTGSIPFPSELINPAPRMTVVSALLRPFEVVTAYEELSSNAADDDDDVERKASPHIPELWELPDTSILFRRYMDAGRMINVYDWYESFAVAMDDQKREHEQKQAKGGRKGRGRHKGKTKQKEISAEEEEEWQTEVHARFIRALHELDFMGFIKHTGRKAGHVMRTIYDIPD